MPRPFPFVGALALALAVATLAAEVSLFRRPGGASAGHDPFDADAQRSRAAAEQQLRLMRFEAGLGVLGVGAALAGWAALAASRRGPADRFLAGAAGVCCLASVAVWLTLATVAGLSDPGEYGQTGSGPGLVIEYDD